MREVLQELSEGFYRWLGVSIDSLSVETEDEQRNIFRIILKTPESNLLIGQHGRNLEAATHLLGRMMESKIGRGVRLHIEINDYVRTQDERLFHLVDKKIQAVLSRGEDVTLERLSAYERKKVHDYIASKNIAGIETFSVGEWNDRKLCIVRGKADMSIAEDGVGI